MHIHTAQATAEHVPHCSFYIAFNKIIFAGNIFTTFCLANERETLYPNFQKKLIDATDSTYLPLSTSQYLLDV